MLGLMYAMVPFVDLKWLMGAGLHVWMDELRFYVLFNNILVISGRCSDDNERLCVRQILPQVRMEFGPLDQ